MSKKTNKTVKKTTAKIRKAGHKAVDGTCNVLENILDGMALAVQTVWTFMGKVYNSIVAYAKAVMDWIGGVVKSAVGKAKDAASYVQAFLASKNVTWLATRNAAVNALAALAAVGVGITAGAVVGVSVASVAMAATGHVLFSQIVGLLTAAATGGVLAEGCYTLARAGVAASTIAQARDEAMAQLHAQLLASGATVGQPVVVNGAVVQAAAV